MGRKSRFDQRERSESSRFSNRTGDELGDGYEARRESEVSSSGQPLRPSLIDHSHQGPYERMQQLQGRVIGQNLNQPPLPMPPPPVNLSAGFPAGSQGQERVPSRFNSYPNERHTSVKMVPMKGSREAEVAHQNGGGISMGYFVDLAKGGLVAGEARYTPLSYTREQMVSQSVHVASGVNKEPARIQVRLQDFYKEVKRDKEDLVYVLTGKETGSFDLKKLATQRDRNREAQEVGRGKSSGTERDRGASSNATESKLGRDSDTSFVSLSSSESEDDQTDTEEAGHKRHDRDHSENHTKGRSRIEFERMRQERRKGAYDRHKRQRMEEAFHKTAEDYLKS